MPGLLHHGNSLNAWNLPTRANVRTLVMMKESPVAAAAEAESAAKATRSDQSDAPAEATKDPKAQQGAGPAVDAKASEVPASEVAIIAEVEKVIAAIRPAVQADKGDVELVSVDIETGIVEVELQGACQSCPASSATLKSGIERIMKDRVPSIVEVVNVGQVFYSDGTPVTL